MNAKVVVIGSFGDQGEVVLALTAVEEQRVLLQVMLIVARSRGLVGEERE